MNSSDCCSIATLLLTIFFPSSFGSFKQRLFLTCRFERARHKKAKLVVHRH